MAESPVSEQTIEPQSQMSTDFEIEIPSTTARDVIKPLEDTPYEFDFWEDLKASWPPWINEVVGFALIVFGILSFISLFVASDALVAVTWAEMLTALFGDGALFVSGTVFVFGIILWLPKVGIGIRFSAARMLALELIFLSSLAILHLSNSDSELRALARAGQGGGLIGWGLSYPFFWILGRPIALVFFSALTALSIVIMIGMRRHHIAAIMSRLGFRLQTFSEDAAQARSEAIQDHTNDLYKRLAVDPGYRTRIMRIRANPESLPAEIAEQRRTAAAAENSVSRVRSAKAVTSAPDPPHDSQSTDPDQAEIEPAPPDSIATTANGSDQQPAPAPSTDVQATAAPPTQSAPPNPSTWLDALPELDCLTPSDMVLPSDDEIERKVGLIQNTLLEFDLETTVIDVQVGPTVTRFALLPHKEDGSDRIRMSKIASYARDLSLALAAKRLRMETPVPGTNFMGIEVPNQEPSIVALRNLLESEEYRQLKRRGRAPLLFPLGRDVTGEPVAKDLTQMPHLLIAGTTGSGKSVCMGAIVTSLLMQYTPDHLRLVMLDPKMVELSRFNGIPHLLGPVETEHERITGVLRWCTAEMDRRYKLLEKRGARNIRMYNEGQLELGADGEPLPYLVMLIDEMGDLMLSNPDETERAITRLAQMARAVGMHLIIATQRPSVDVITGLIKANFPARIAFSVSSSTDSRVIIDRSGAEDLLGRGDMLFLSSDAAGPVRIQGCYVAEDDVREVVSHWRAEQAARAERGETEAKPSAPWKGSLERRHFLTETDPMLEDVLKLVVNSGEASASLIQRRLGLGYPRAARIMDLLEDLGVVGNELGGGRSREVVIPPDQDPLDFVMERFRTRNLNR